MDFRCDKGMFQRDSDWDVGLRIDVKRKKKENIGIAIVNRNSNARMMD